MLKEKIYVMLKKFYCQPELVEGGVSLLQRLRQAQPDRLKV